MIDAVGLRKEYGEVVAVAGSTFSVEPGEIFGLVGPNGAGKTTFIEVLVGLVDPTGGTARVFGHDVETDYREARNAIGLAPQEFDVDRFFPIREVLQHKAGYHGIPWSEAGRRADEALSTVGIYHKRAVHFDWLSGGMKRRFLLARALVTDPDLLILDEPTAGVDVQLRRELWDLITRMNDAGTTVLLTTHYIEEAERLCDQVAILDHGRLVDVASPDELRDRGTDTITLRLAKPPATTPDFAHEAIETVTLEGDRLSIRARNGGEVAPAVITSLADDGLRVVDMDVARTSLEDVFVELTADSADVADSGAQA